MPATVRCRIFCLAVWYQRYQD